MVAGLGVSLGDPEYAVHWFWFRTISIMDKQGKALVEKCAQESIADPFTCDTQSVRTQISGIQRQDWLTRSKERINSIKGETVTVTRRTTVNRDRSPMAP